MWLVDRQFPALRWIAAPWNRLGLLFLAIGIGLDACAAWSFIRERTTINPMNPSRTNRLVVFGVYRISRNPMYLGLAMSLSGWALLLGSPVCLTLVWVFAHVLVLVQIAPEEAALHEKFGAAYLEYSRRVNRWIGRRIN